MMPAIRLNYNIIRVYFLSANLAIKGIEMSKIVDVVIPAPNGELTLTLDAGRSTLFIGANGSGKTRLGVRLEQSIANNRVHRIAAHRSLAMTDTVKIMGLAQAMQGFTTGHAGDGGHRESHRYHGKPAVAQVNDFDNVMSALFAEQNLAAITHMEKHRLDHNAVPPVTVLSKLAKIWERLLPHRKLKLLDASIEVTSPTSPSDAYRGSEMSDGERVIFYLIGQTLMAPKDSVLIIDEPELHIHKAILALLWDAIEAERKDCAFVYISHDLDFVTARPAATKLLVRSFVPPAQWEIEPLPANTELPERVISELIGSRQPILFVEGERGSADTTIYRAVYPTHLVQPIGNCDAVIHAVATFGTNTSLHRVGKVQGCIDADARTADEKDGLLKQSVHVLPVSEIENVLLLPQIFSLISKALHFEKATTDNQVTALANEIIGLLAKDMEPVSVRYAIRRLDAALKTLAPKASSIANLVNKYQSSIANIDPKTIAECYKAELEAVIKSNDLAKALALYDNKGLLSVGARHLGLKGRDELIEFVGRLIGSEDGKEVLQALKSTLPSIT